jgi:hypothetical protein
MREAQKGVAAGERGLPATSMMGKGQEERPTFDRHTSAIDGFEFLPPLGTAA